MTMRLPGEIPADWRRRGALAGVVLMLMLTSFAFGRFSKQATVVHDRSTVRETLTVADTKSATTAASSSSTGVAVDHTIEETHRPDGTVTIVKHDVETKIVYRDVVRTVEVEKRVEVAHNVYLHRYAGHFAPAPAQWRVGLQAGLTTSPTRVTAPTLLFPIIPVDAGLSLERRIVGPVWGGAWVNTDKSAGLSLAVEF
jgi:hypothetical protein